MRPLDRESSQQLFRHRFRSVSAWPAASAAALILALSLPASAHASDMEDEAAGDAGIILVTAYRYGMESAHPVAKLPADIHDLPVTVDQVTSALLDDRAVISADETLETVAGVRLSPSFPGASGYVIRGFAESYNVNVDGFRDEQARFDPQGIERIDVLKGPPSVQFGANSPGGVVNIISKRPRPEAAYSAGAIVGSFDERRFTADLNHPVADGDVLLRLNGAWGDAGNFRDFVTTSTRYIAPALTLNISPDDTLTVLGSYMHFKYTGFSDFPVNPVFLDVPVSLSLSEPGLPQNRAEQWRGSYDYTHDFGGGWKVRSALGFSRGDIDYGLSRVYYPYLLDDGRTLVRTGAHSEGPQYVQALTVQKEVYAAFNTGSLHHNLAFGFEYYSKKFHYTNYTADLPPLDILAPVYGAQISESSLAFIGGSGDHNYAGFIQDLISIGDQWKLMLGARYDRNTSYSDFYASWGYESNSRDTVSHLSPRAGLVFQPRPSTSLYGSWSRSFMPQVSSIAADGAVLEPATGEQFEVGVKQHLFGQRLTLTGAAYRITRQNVAASDPSSPAFEIATGEQRSQGFELSLAGELSRSWNIVASYALTDAKVTRDIDVPSSPSLVGEYLGGVPRHAFSLWTQYELDSGALAGLGGGLGVIHASHRPAGLASGFDLPGYTRLDAQISYRFADRYRLAVNVKNLNDVKYHDTDGAYILRPGAPRTVLASLRAEI